MNYIGIDDFDFNLPDELIAQNPLPNRLQAKMLVVDNKQLIDSSVNNICDYLLPNDIIIFNNTKVIPARLVGYKNDAKINITLHYKLNNYHWLAFVKNSKRLKANDTIVINEHFKIVVLEKLDTGEVKLSLPYDNIFELLEKYGYLPLPPYIKRDNINNTDDKDNYQSIFAQEQGAVASPTASLHFTQELIARIEEKKVKIEFITLHVGAGTFLPVKTENILEHKMHKEYGSISQQTIDSILQAKRNGGRVIAIGTTVLRTLEYIGLDVNDYNSIQPFSGEIDLFIYPSFEFKVVDCLLTNFHLPKSTLFMLVSAFAGLQNMKNVYNHAIHNQYRFFSYGDCCFLNKLK
jgi:S-adenosylmethionine:tRNA ribosyltransferase-isomerase